MAEFSHRQSTSEPVTDIRFVRSSRRFVVFPGEALKRARSNEGREIPQSWSLLWVGRKNCWAGLPYTVIWRTLFPPLGTGLSAFLNCRLMFLLCVGIQRVGDTCNERHY